MFRVCMRMMLLLFVVLSGLSCVVAWAQSERAAGTERPNIIFLLTDDQRWDALGAMGNSIIQTPHMDQLARAGILFQNAYVTTSICCVSRASIFTGQYESRHQINNFNTDFSPAALAKTYPALLKKAGYKLGFIGKFGVGTHPPAELFDYWVNTEGGGLTQPNYINVDKNGHKIHDTDTIGHAIQQFLDVYGQREDQPFCLSVSFKAPHEQDKPRKYVIQPRYKDYYEDAVIPEPVTADPKYWQQFPAFFQTDKNVGRVRWNVFFSTPERYQQSVKDYYRLITGVDDVVGQMVDKLKKLGIDKKTIILFMGDNGFSLGEHGLEGKWYGYEESIRVPFFIYDPKLPDEIRQIRPEQLVLNIDVAPTILRMAGVPVPDSMQGVDLIALLKNEIPARQDFFYQHYFMGSPRIPKVEGVVTTDFKYMNYIEHGYEELFDVKHDPHETINLAKEANYRMELLKLRKRYQELKKAVE